MTLKQYNFVRIVVAMFLAALVGQAVILNNFYLAGAAVLIAIGLIILTKRRVKEVIADERDYEIAGKAARWSLTIFSAIGSIAVLVLMSLRQKDPVFEAIGAVLAYSICALLLLNSLIFGYLNRYEK